MEIHRQAPARALWVRLLSDGQVLHQDGSAYPAPATWRTIRCWPRGRRQDCLLHATIEHQTYFANLDADRLTTLTSTESVSVCLERFAKR